ncbi:MAG: 50S ribosomal protein L9 [Candidatus Schekmanbacteria bacterium]|nr:50S ribosomal protein L9 [Candidatus Schekmanbacteria bacterium]
MKVVLLTDVDKLGSLGSVVNVANGYARNFLLPRQFALPATDANLKQAEKERTLRLKRDNKQKTSAGELAQKIQAVSCTIAMQVGENDRLFGSVTAIDIAKSLADEGIEIDKRSILLEEPLKALGIYDVPVKLHTDVTATLKVWVVAKN